MVPQAILPLMLRDDDGSRAGTVRDDAGSLGGYLNLTHVLRPVG